MGHWVMGHVCNGSDEVMGHSFVTHGPLWLAILTRLIEVLHTCIPKCVKTQEAAYW